MFLCVVVFIVFGVAYFFFSDHWVMVFSLIFCVACIRSVEVLFFDVNMVCISIFCFLVCVSPGSSI